MSRIVIFAVAQILLQKGHYIFWENASSYQVFFSLSLSLSLSFISLEIVSSFLRLFWFLREVVLDSIFHVPASLPSSSSIAVYWPFSIFQSGIASFYLLFWHPGDIPASILSLEIVTNLSAPILGTCSSQSFLHLYINSLIGFIPQMLWTVGFKSIYLCFSNCFSLLLPYDLFQIFVWYLRFPFFLLGHLS